MKPHGEISARSKGVARETPNRRLARRVAKALFRNGSGEIAERLVLELKDRRNGGGWCLGAVEDVVEREMGDGQKGQTSIVFDKDDDVTNFALDWLQRRGWLTTLPKKSALLTPAEFHTRYARHLGHRAFIGRLNHAACPTFAAERGPTGRLRLIAPTQALIDWIQRPATPGIALGCGGIDNS